ncbi:hypothetical protein [Nonomuraea endophytica]|uniref:hypothetical protein n=1 Tax=Nonomuraea endophytica TaxID=714136 RepID=UPI0037C5C3B0
MTQPPAEAYPIAIYSSNDHITPDKIRCESSKTAWVLWIDGLCLTVPPDADDTRLIAAEHVALTIADRAQRHAQTIRAELDRRATERRHEVGIAQVLAAAERRPPAGPGPRIEPVAPVPPVAPAGGPPGQPAHPRPAQPVQPPTEVPRA